MISVACENIRLSSLFVAGELSRGGTSTTAKSEEKRMFSQAMISAIVWVDKPYF